MAVSSVQVPGRQTHPGTLERGERIRDLRGAPELERGAQRVAHREAQHGADGAVARGHPSRSLAVPAAIPQLRAGTFVRHQGHELPQFTARSVTLHGQGSTSPMPCPADAPGTSG